MNSLDSYSPIDNQLLGSVMLTTDEEYEETITELQAEFLRWRDLPAPKRGLIVKEIGVEITKAKNDLAKLITLENGKILEEGKGEVQEIIDIIDYAVGLSRQLWGKTIKSERPEHQALEKWQPLGIVGVITAFNFPTAVWGWNAMIAAVCGNVVLWKPSELTPIVAEKLIQIAQAVTARHGFPNVFALTQGAGDLGQKIAKDKRIALVSATGSTEMGRSVAVDVGQRLGKMLLELGGNNAVIVMDDADLDLALPALVFGAVGTAGQRCTTTRRIIAHQKIKTELTKRLLDAYQQIRIGNPLDADTLVGPLINQQAVDSYLFALEQIKKQGGKILCGGKVVEGLASTNYVEPTLVEIQHDAPIVFEETFAPITYILECNDLDEAIAINNEVPQGLSSAIFTLNLRNSQKFISHLGSDCGIANVNIGTSGAEIGGAFGGEKDTGGGRQSGSDSWRTYMRRQTCTVNYGTELPLAQGIKFEI